MAKALGIKLVLILLFVFSFALFISSCASARQCYVSPCYQGKGLEMLWSVHDGEGFQLVVNSMLVLAHAFSAYLVLFRSSFSSLKYGMLVSTSLMLAFLMLCQGITWGVKSSMVQDISDYQAGASVYEFNEYCDTYNRTIGEESCNSLGKSCHWYHFFAKDDQQFGCFRRMFVDVAAKDRFNAVLAFSILLFLTQSSLSFMLLLWRDDFNASSSEQTSLAQSEGGGGGGARSKIAHVDGEGGYGEYNDEGTSHRGEKGGEDIGGYQGYGGVGDSFQAETA